MKAKAILMAVAIGAPLFVTAQNPIIRDQFTADPTARVFNNKVYLYPSHDIKPSATSAITRDITNERFINRAA